MNWAEIVGWTWGLGFRIAMPLVALTLGGRFLDRRLNTEPWFLILGIILAILVTIVWIAHTLRPLLRESTHDAEQEQDNGGAGPYL